MLSFPDRISGLMAKVEAGTATQLDADRVAILQVLDLAKAGEDFIRQAVAADLAQSQRLPNE